MEDPRWLRLVTIGLVLAALAVGYFLLTGRLVSNSATRVGSQASKAPSATAVATPTSSPTPTPSSAYERIVSRNQGNVQGVQTLPRTGFPVSLAIVFSISTIISGLSLSRFPR